MNAIDTIVGLTPVQAEAAVRGALTEEGFGVLTEIDVAATLKPKLGINQPPLKILGVCNPTLAARALAIVPSVSVLVPCNVVVDVVDGRTRVTAVDPQAHERPPIRRAGRRRRDPAARRDRPRRGRGRLSGHGRRHRRSGTGGVGGRRAGGALPRRPGTPVPKLGFFHVGCCE